MNPAVHLLPGRLADLGVYCCLTYVSEYDYTIFRRIPTFVKRTCHSNRVLSSLKLILKYVYKYVITTKSLSTSHLGEPQQNVDQNYDSTVANE